MNTPISNSQNPIADVANPVPRAGYTLPVFACAAAIAALQHLRSQPGLEQTATARSGDRALHSVQVDLIEPAQTVAIAIEQVARLSPQSALAIARSDPGDNLDLTRNTPIWASVTLTTLAPPPLTSHPKILLQGGEGVGRLVNADQQAAIYAYAQRLITENLTRLLADDEAIEVTIILPEGRSLAARTSNAAFGVVEGLSLIGTSGIAQPLSAPGQLDLFRQDLQRKTDFYDGLVFCVGENGLDLAQKLGIHPDRLIKTANWLGSMLVEAGLQGVRSILLFGYHGKLLKLAGGIFHTHHYIADGRQEIFAANCIEVGMPTALVQQVCRSASAEAGLQFLQLEDARTGSRWVEMVYQSITQKIDARSQAFIQSHCDRTLTLGSVLFGRDRRIIDSSATGKALLTQLRQQH